MTVAELVELLTSSRAYQEGLAAQTEVMILNRDRVAEAIIAADVKLYTHVHTAPFHTAWPSKQ